MSTSSQDDSIGGTEREQCLHATCSVTTQLHLAAITSMKGEINELKTRLQHVSSERDLLERQLSMTQSDTFCSQREIEARVEQVTARYEERIIELHSVIAELRKKLECHHINVIREEDEFEESEGAQSNRSQDGGSNHDNLGVDSHSASLEMGKELRLELSRVVTEMESAMASRSPLVPQVAQVVEREGSERETRPAPRDEDNEYDDEEEESKPPTPPPRHGRVPVPQPSSPAHVLRSGRPGPGGPGGPGDRRDLLAQREAELAQAQETIVSLTAEREVLCKKVWELQNHVSSETPPSPACISATSKTQSPNFAPERRGTGDQFPVAKVAELKKLRTLTGDRQALGAEVSSLGLPTTQTAEHLVQNIKASSGTSSSEVDASVVEYRLELERVQSRADHLRAQNDTLVLTLVESKAHAERLSVLVGKYESNATALALALGYSDQALEACQVLVALLDSEIGVLLANCRAAGIGGFAGFESGDDEQGEVSALLQRSHGSRRAAESVARHLLHRMDRSRAHVMSCCPSPWDDVTSISHTTSSTDSGDGEFGKAEEQRLRDYVLQLRSERSAVRATVMELEPVHVDPFSMAPHLRYPDPSRFDLENAVLMQELMAMKEERAELKAANYLLEKESRALELRLAALESTEAAHRITIQHLRSELQLRAGNVQDSDRDYGSAPVSVAELRSHDPMEMARDLAAALTREQNLKSRVHELVSTLEKITQNSEVRHKQSAEFVNDLKRANSALITAFEKAKKRYQGKLKKLEIQLKSVTERYETQIQILKQRLALYEDESSRPPLNETSL